MAAKEPSRLVPVLLIVVVLVIAGIGAGLVYYFNHKSSGNPRLTIQVGYNATVNYIGFFGSGPQQGRVFDTSIYSVYTNNVTYPKSLGFLPHGNASAYTPLPVHVGPNAPQSGYSLNGLSFIEVVTGFWQGLVGMPGNQTTSITVPPSLGYGFPSASCYQNASISFSVPSLVTMTNSQFSSAYPGKTATQGTQFPDPTYGWPVYVLSANATSVVLQNQPTVGWSAKTGGWYVEVTAVNATTISLVNELNPSQAGLVSGTASTSVCGESTFIVSAINLATGTYTRDFNKEVVGQTLVFQVTVVGIFPD
jgi:hypothetical protein